MLSVTLRQLEYVIAIERYQGVSAAAAALSVSQPALSVALHQVEVIIGKPLFLRRPGSPMIATSFGRDFLEGAATIVDDVSRLVKGAGFESGGPVSVGFYEGLAPLLLAPVLSHLDKALPDIAVKPFVGSFEDISHGLAQTGQIDCAITYDLGLDNAFSRDELARLPIQAVVSASHSFALAGSATMAQVASEPIIVTDEGLSKAHMLRLFTERGHGLSIAHEASTMETMRSLAANGLGVGLSYTHPKAEVTYDGKGVRQVPIIDARSAEPVIVVSHRDNALSMNAEAVRSEISKMAIEL